MSAARGEMAAKKKAPEEARKYAIKLYINRERPFPGCFSGRASYAHPRTLVINQM
jgi:hypothetical protein